MKFAAKSYLIGAFMIACSSLPAPTLLAAASGANNEVLFSFQGKTYRQQDLSPAVRQALFDADKLRYDNMKRILENAMLEEHIAEKAKKSGKPKEKIEEEIFKADVTEATAKAWYEENKARLAGRDFDTIKNEVIHYLKRQEQEKIRDSVVASVQKEGKFSTPLKEPVSPVFEINSKGFPSRGPDNAKVTVVEFADYTCPHCQAASSSMKKVAEQFKDKVKFVFMDFPLREEGVPALVAQGAVCADEQKKFWEYHYMAFEQQASLSPSSPEDLAKKLSLDVGKFKTCMQQPGTKKKVLDARNEGERLGIQGTPAIYINGRRHNGYAEETLTAEIKKLL